MKKSNSLLKRKYGKDGHVIASLNGPKRNKILEFVNIHGKVDIRSMRMFISDLNESKHNSSASTSMWMKRNEKYFIRESKNGGIYYKLSPLGKRLLNSVNEGKENKSNNKLVKEMLSNASTYNKEIEKANESIQEDPTSRKSLRKKELLEELIRLNEEDEDNKKMLLDDDDEAEVDVDSIGDDSESEFDFDDEDVSGDEGDEGIEKVEITEFILTVDDVDAAIEELESKDIIASKVPDLDSEDEDSYKSDEISVNIEDWEKLKEWLEEKGIDVEDMFGGEIEVEDIEDLDDTEGEDDTEREGAELEDFDLEEEEVSECGINEDDEEDEEGNDDITDDEATDADFDFDDDDDFDFDDEGDEGDESDEGDDFDFDDEGDEGDEGEDETDLGLQLIDIGKKLIQNDQD